MFTSTPHPLPNPKGASKQWKDTCEALVKGCQHNKAQMRDACIDAMKRACMPDGVKGIPEMVGPLILPISGGRGEEGGLLAKAAKPDLLPFCLLVLPCLPIGAKMGPLVGPLIECMQDKKEEISVPATQIFCIIIAKVRPWSQGCTKPHVRTES